MSRRNVAKQALYRNPEFLGGKCVCCRKRMRDFMDANYPSMCTPCRVVRLKNMPMIHKPQEIPALDMDTIKGLHADLAVSQPNTQQTEPEAPTTHEEMERLRALLPILQGESLTKAKQMLGLE